MENYKWHESWVEGFYAVVAVYLLISDKVFMVGNKFSMNCIYYDDYLKREILYNLFSGNRQWENYVVNY